jgi:hypothetical protein
MSSGGGACRHDGERGDMQRGYIYIYEPPLQSVGEGEDANEEFCFLVKQKGVRKMSERVSGLLRHGFLFHSSSQGV